MTDFTIITEPGGEGQQIFLPGKYIKITAVATVVRGDGSEESRIEVSQYLRK